MKIHFVTIVLDGMPFITWHYPTFRQLKLDWHWTVVEGVAIPKRCTSWCANLEPRLSLDGTHEYMRDLAMFDKRVTLIVRSEWPGKAAMFNEALDRISEPEYLLWQVDSDEIWRADQIELAAGLLSQMGSANCMWFRCRYYVGPDLVITSRNGHGNNEAYEWRRLWRVPRGTRFFTHEPPILEGYTERPWRHDETERLGLVFDHYAYATVAQMRFKERYYGGPSNAKGKLYRDCPRNWMRLQANAQWPIKELASYLPWVGPSVTVDQVAQSS